MAALETTTLALDPARSSLTIFGPSEPIVGPIPLSGALTIQFDEAPALGVVTSFEVLALDVTGTDTSLSLDTTFFAPTGTAGSSLLVFSR